MKSFLGLGGKSRDETSTQKVDSRLEEAQRQRDEEEKRRIREHYERLREKEAEANRVPHSTTPGGVRREAQRIYGSPNYGHSPQGGMSASVPEYESYDLIDRYQMHRYPTAEVGPTGGVSPAGIAPFHHRVLYSHPQPPPYHYAIPSSKSYHGSPVAVAASHYQSYAEYAPECPPHPQQRPATGSTPDYYRMFNSWFAYSGEGGGNTSLKAAYTSPLRPTIDVSGRSPSNLVGIAGSRNAMHYTKLRHGAAEPSQLSSHYTKY
ncbi:hypothetical protein TELCIR_20160 [Teladorsagia circumcincta]|uniref:Uncharacterized protein n=1 Tax=Teladorsagia circumcincta TaxID=45464 RepID=A0A2G9TK93_TELCI|nr:hypothetical protein TELCIR_20160 [Teladorsagia circumcincta]